MRVSYQASLLINSTRDEKALSRIKKELKQVLARWSSGKDEVLQVCEARFDSWFCRNNFNIRHRCLLIPSETRKN
jgi:hypothetical protein